MKEAGNRKFKKKKYEAAREHFGKVIDLIEGDFLGNRLDKVENSHIKDLYLNLHTNKALCSHKLSEYSEVIKDCNKVIKH